MLLKAVRFFILVCCTGGCVNYAVDRPSGTCEKKDLALEEMRIQLGDLRHALEAEKVEIGLLQERLQEEEALSSSLVKQHKESALTQRLTALEFKLSQIEARQELIVADLKGIAQLAEKGDKVGRHLQVEMTSLQNAVLDLRSLKGTLEQVSKSLHQREEPSFKKKESRDLYLVRTGDTLQKIAKKRSTTVEQLKILNHLSSDHIVPGQELLITHEQP